VSSHGRGAGDLPNPLFSGQETVTFAGFYAEGMTDSRFNVN